MLRVWPLGRMLGEPGAFMHFWETALWDYIVQRSFPERLAFPFDYRMWGTSPGTVLWRWSFSLTAASARWSS